MNDMVASDIKYIFETYKMKHKYKRKGYNYLMYPGLTPSQMNREQFSHWGEYIEILAMQIPSDEFCEMMGTSVVRVMKSGKIKFNIRKR